MRSFVAVLISAAIITLVRVEQLRAQQPLESHRRQESTPRFHGRRSKLTFRPQRLPPVNRQNPMTRRWPPIQVRQSSRPTAAAGDSTNHRRTASRQTQPLAAPGLADPRVDAGSRPQLIREPVPWWQPAVLAPLRNSSIDLYVDANTLIMEALRHSGQVRALSDSTLIAESSITRAAAEFDAQAFIETKLVRTSVPTGSTLDAGFNVPRLRDEDWFTNAGIRRKNRHGGSFEMSQQIGLRDSNSQFFFPANQGNARLTLSYNQPLLHGFGEPYNNSLIVLAQIDTQLAASRAAAELQDHLLAVTEALWELYHERALWLQQRQHLGRAQVILERLERRRGIDSLESQIARARAAVAMRSADMIRAATSIQNAEARIRSLVQSPAMLADRQAELIPRHSPLREFISISLENAILTALENRPEISAAMREIEAARIRLGVAQNELLPVLDIVLETYVSGLRGNSDIGSSLGAQFSEGQPSHTAGFLFEVPLHRRAARANHHRRLVEIRQLSSRLDAALETLHAEVEIAVREVDTSYRESQAKQASMLAAVADVEYLQQRWEQLPGDDRAASFSLADLLDAQDRLSVEEAGLVRVQVDYTLSLVRLNRALGKLLRHEPIQPVPADPLEQSPQSSQ